LNFVKFAVISAVFAMVAGSASAASDAVPGRSLWGIPLGSRQRDAANSVRMHFKGLHKSYKESHARRHGITDDTWETQIGDNLTLFEVLSRNGKVVQLQEFHSAKQDQLGLTFKQLIKRYSLQKHVYNFTDPNGGGYVGFYYDDRSRGICYSLGVQDSFLLTYGPDTTIVHPKGASVIPMAAGLWGAPVTGENARAYANAEEAERAEQKQ